MSTYKYKPSVNSNGVKSMQHHKTNNKYRIYQIFKPTIQLDELSLQANLSNRKNYKLDEEYSLRYPLIKINNYIVSNEEIDILTIDSTGFIPTVTLKCTFIHQKFISTELPKDGDIISIAIRNKSDVLKILRNDFVITGVSSVNNYTDVYGMNTMTFFGVLFIPGLSSIYDNYSFKGTSLKAIQDVAHKLGLGFATNEDDTDDKQIWIKGLHPTSKYIQSIVKHSWKDDKSFYDVWIDLYYNLNFVNVNKQLLSDESKVDLGVWLNNIDIDYVYGSDTDENKAIGIPNVLSNYEKYKNTSYYIRSWKPINRSSNITFDIGTKMICQMFEHNNKLYNNPSAIKNWSIPLEPIYDPQKTKSYILLRGRATQDPSTRGNDLAQVNYSYPNLYINKSWMGNQYTVSNPDSSTSEWDGNHHRNYYRAKLQNLINNKELEKLNVEVNIIGTNLNIIKGDKIPIFLIKSDSFENAMIKNDIGANDLLDTFYSGWYYVKGSLIKYTQDRSNSNYSNFEEKIVLTRREWPPPITVQSSTHKNNK